MYPRRATVALASLGLFLALPFLAFSAKVPQTESAEPSAETTHAAELRAPTGPRQPANLTLRWVRETQPLEPAWPDQPRMQLDAAAKPVPLGKLVLLTSSRTDGVTASDAASGVEAWRFHADGPVRFAPAVWNGRAYVGSDDGFLYCLDGVSGHVLWKMRGAGARSETTPQRGTTPQRLILGNERLISTWPVRGAPPVAPSPLPPSPAAA